MIFLGSTASPGWLDSLQAPPRKGNFAYLRGCIGTPRRVTPVCLLNLAKCLDPESDAVAHKDVEGLSYLNVTHHITLKF